jgi:peptide/nickel transport system ATP-binding protein
MTTVLDVRNLSIDYLNNRQALHAVEDVSFQVEAGRALALVGESGCGKTTTMLGLLRLLPREGRIVNGSILYHDVDLLQLSEAQMREYRWNHIAIIFQGAMNALNPVRTIGDQIAEARRIHGYGEDRKRARELLELVGIPASRADHYPHEFSGGMRQRVMIAMALAAEPDVLVADEPTTALDVMIQAQILDLLSDLRKQLNLALVLVTHDLGVVAETCDDVLVMYGGKVAEYGTVDAIFNSPRHPYTRRLMQAFPDLEDPDGQMISIPGYPPPLSALPSGCRFEPRCYRRTEKCVQHTPALQQVDAGHSAACHYALEPE